MFIWSANTSINQPSAENIFPVFCGSHFLESDNLHSNFFDILTFRQNSLLSLTSHYTLNFKTYTALGGHSSKEIQEYIVQKGDTISKIAQKFGIDENTILWANKLSKKSIIRPGQKLIILPTSGVLHLVKKGDTVSSLAKLYRVKKEEIIEFNELDEKGTIYVGDLLVIPGGKPPTRIASYKKPSNYYPDALNNTTQHLIWPIPSPHRITQGLHWYNAVDMATGRCNDPVYASAGGTIQKIGYDRWLGKYVRILHPNGIVTLYAHLSKIIVVPGQRVSQGEIIGYIGYTGRTIPPGPRGCHLHFEVRGGRNPFAF